MAARFAFTDLKVKVIGPSLGGGNPADMIDRDMDGRCREANGNFIPCPPGVGTARAAARVARAAEAVVPDESPSKVLMSGVAKRRSDAKQKAKKIREIAKQNLPNEVRDYFRGKAMQDYLRGPASDAEKKKYITRMYDHDLVSKDGKSFRSVTTRVVRGGDTWSVSGDILDANGRKVGFFDRIIYPDEGKVYHAHFKVDAAHAKDGIGSAFITSTEILYKDADIPTVEVTGLSNTGDYVGATHWPKSGYIWRNAGAKREFLDHVQKAVESYESGRSPDLFDSAEQAAEVKKLIESAKSKPFDRLGNDIDAGDLLFWPGSEQWFKQRHANIEYKKPLF